MKSIKETTELLVAVAGISKKLKSDKADDGKISLIELAGLVTHWRSLKAGFDGLEEIPAELKDMDTVELAELYTAVAQELDVELSPHLQARVAAYMNLVQGMIRIYRVEQGLPESDTPPPVAESVEDPTSTVDNFPTSGPPAADTAG